MRATSTRLVVADADAAAALLVATTGRRVERRVTDGALTLVLLGDLHVVGGPSDERACLAGADVVLQVPSADELDLAVHDALDAGARLTCPCEDRPFVRRARVSTAGGPVVELAAWTHPGLTGRPSSPWADGTLPDVWD